MAHLERANVAAVATDCVGNGGEIEWPWRATLVGGDAAVVALINGRTDRQQCHRDSGAAIILQRTKPRVDRTVRRPDLIPDTAPAGAAVGCANQIESCRGEIPLGIGQIGRAVAGDDGVPDRCRSTRLVNPTGLAGGVVAGNCAVDQCIGAARVVDPAAIAGTAAGNGGAVAED